MCMSQMCQEITAASSQHLTHLWLSGALVFDCSIYSCLYPYLNYLPHSSHLLNKKSYIYTFLTRLDLFLHERDVTQRGFNCQCNHVNILNGPMLHLIYWIYRQSPDLTTLQQICVFLGEMWDLYYSIWIKALGHLAPTGTLMSSHSKHIDINMKLVLL